MDNATTTDSATTTDDTTTAEKFLLMAFGESLLALSSVDASRTYWQEECTKANLKLSRIPLEDRETAKFRLAEDARCGARAQVVRLGEARSRAEGELQAMYLKAVRGAGTLDGMTKEELTALRDRANAKIYNLPSSSTSASVSTQHFAPQESGLSGE